VITRAVLASVLLLISIGAMPAHAASDIADEVSSSLDVNGLREEALARLAPQVRDTLRAVRVQVVARPIPRTAPGAAACFDLQSGTVMLGADIETRYGREFARSALMHEYGHALAWLRFHWDLRDFRARFQSAMFMPGSENYPVFAEFVQRHLDEAMTSADYSELFPAVLLEVRSAAVLPPPLRSYLSPFMWP